MRYDVFIPATDEMPAWTGVVAETTMETKEENALWHYNSSREHDALDPVTELPDGTKFRQKNY